MKEFGTQDTGYRRVGKLFWILDFGFWIYGAISSGRRVGKLFWILDLWRYFTRE